MDALVRFEMAAGSGTGVALGERTLLVAESVEVESVVEVGDDDGFTVVHPLILLALDIARGFATLSEERVDVDRGIENRVRAEASEGTGMDGAGQQQGSTSDGKWVSRGYLVVGSSLSRTAASVAMTGPCTTFPHTAPVGYFCAKHSIPTLTFGICR
jgi:hypothetical protein